MQHLVSTVLLLATAFSCAAGAGVSAVVWSLIMRWLSLDVGVARPKSGKTIGRRPSRMLAFQPFRR